MSLLILHIPHSSAHIPSREAYLLSAAELDAELLKLTDWYTDDLFNDGDDLQIVAKFSRLYCDVERFPYDEMEVMAEYGMGVLYDRTDDGRPMRVVTDGMRWMILNQTYREHQRRLSHVVKRQVICHNKALILDCHSFSDTPFIRDLHQDTKRPDFNIGTDPFHTPPELVDLSLAYFQELGYSAEVDKPYSGSIVPMDYYQKDHRVHSIMLEVNRKLYLNPGTNVKSPDYERTKAVIHGYIGMLRQMHKDGCRKL